MMYPGNLLHLIIRLSGRTQIAVVATVAVWQCGSIGQANMQMALVNMAFIAVRDKTGRLPDGQVDAMARISAPRQRVELPPAGGQLHPTSGEM